MKKKGKVVMTLGILALVGVLAVAVYAWACGRGLPFGPGNWCQGGGSYSNLTEKQRGQIDELKQKFHNDTAKLREDMRTKSEELRTLLDASDPDPKKVKAAQKEISDLVANMAQHRIDFQLEARKIVPDGSYAPGCGTGCGRGCGRGFGPYMKGHGPHMGSGCGWGPWGHKRTG